MKMLLFLAFFVFSGSSWGMGMMESKFEPSSPHQTGPLPSKMEVEERKNSENLYLVVGSVRKESYINPFAKKIFGEEVDPTHRKTFGGNAITLDLKPSSISGAPHIQEDAKSFKPKPKTRMQAVFMELFPSIYMASSIEEFKGGVEWENMMLMPNTIRNLAQYMEEGAILEIEHLPLTTFMDMEHYVQAVQIVRRYNPFHGFLSPFFMENIESRKYLGPENKFKFWQSVLGAKKTLFAWDDAAAGRALHEAITSHPKLLQAMQNIINLLPNETSLQGRLDTESNLYKADPANFFENIFQGSLSELIALEFTMLNQQDLIKNFLERNGFKNPRVERVDNPYNNRKNVWMISATRNNKPIPHKDDITLY